MTPATVLLSPMRINVICIPMANTVAGTMRGRTVRKDIKSFPRNRYRIRALDVSTPIAADKTATTEEIIMLDAMRENNSPFLLTISMTARSESTWGNRPGQAHRSVNTHTTRLAAGLVEVPCREDRRLWCRWRPRRRHEGALRYREFLPAHERHFDMAVLLALYMERRYRRPFRRM